MARFDEPAPQTFHVPTETPEETGFWDNADAAYEQAKREDLPIFSPAQSNQAMEFRKSVIDKHVRDGAVTPEMLEFYETNEGYDIDGLSHYMKNDLGLDDVVTPQEYEKSRNEEYNDLRAKEEQIFAGQTKMGFVGEMGGGMASMVHDPIYMGGVVLGYGVAGTILESTVMATAASSAVIESGIEVAATPAKMSFKKELGLEYGASEAVINILAAGAFGGILGGAGKFVSNKFAKLNPTDMTVDEAIERLASFAGPGRNNEIAPILNVLAKADPQESAAKVLARDEKISVAQNNRGAKAGADPRANAKSGHGEDAELAYNKMKATQEKNAVEASEVADKGVPQGTPSETPKVKAYPEDTHPAVAAKYDEVAELDARLAKIEEVC